MRYRCQFCGKRFATRPLAKLETHACVEEVREANRILVAKGLAERSGGGVALTAQGKALAAARRKAREAGLDPEVVAPV